MKKDIIEKTCLNCDKFRQHYTKGVSDMFITEYGHCKSYETQLKLIKTNEENPACKFWEPLQSRQSDYERVMTALNIIQRKLNLIELILKDE